ncbi:DUF6063 family protein [Peribacillus frigoritolerans]|uniref:DUF6063 family protein n=1 Tax=Peribacillus frigoritolerans TaxID=450367 RepID=UPI002E23650F|nr:DUF6063 family protein [Peribacillus frigoritolerans]
MLNMESVEIANEIYSALLVRRALKDTDSLVTQYKDKDNESVRQILKNRCKVEGTEILLGNSYLHLIARDNSVYASSFSVLKEKHYSLENKRLLHLIGLIQFTFFSESSTDITSSQIDWLHNGISYYKLIEDVDKVITPLYERQLKTDGEFSKSFSIAIDDIYHIWKDKDTDSPFRKIVTANNKTKFGLVHTAMKILQEDGLVFIKVIKKNAEAVPTQVLHERLDLQFNNNSKFQEIKNMITQIKTDRPKEF